MTGNAETSQQPSKDELSEAETASSSWIEHPTTVQHLQTLVIVLGVVLIIGFATVIGRIAYLAMNSEDGNVATTTAQGNQDHAAKVTGANGLTGPASETSSATVSSGPDLIIPIPPNAHIKQITPTAGGLLVRFDDPRGTAAYLIDAQTGAIKRRYRFQPQQP
ncbi:MAG: hypothetical protein RIC14_11730 [Filomicrobium sp.]